MKFFHISFKICDPFGPSFLPFVSKVCTSNSQVFQTFVPLSAGIGVALADFGRRRKRSLKEGRTWVSDLDVAKVRLENNTEMFLKKLSLMKLQ